MVGGLTITMEIIMKNILTKAIVFLLALSFCPHTLASDTEDANSKLKTFVNEDTQDSFIGLNNKLATLETQDLAKLNSKDLERASKLVTERMPSCFCMSEDLGFPWSENMYRNVILYASYVKPAISNDASEDILRAFAPLDSLNALCSLYYRHGNMDEQMTTAFGKLEQHYGFQITRKSIGEIFLELPMGDNVMALILYGPQLLITRVLGRPMYRNATALVLAAMVLKSYFL